MRAKYTATVLLSLASGALAQEPPAEAPTGFVRAAQDFERELRESLAEFAALQASIAAEKIPLNEQLGALMSELADIGDRYDDAQGRLEKFAVDASNLVKRNKELEEEADYVSNLLGQYLRELDSRLHICERQHYSEELDAALLAPENTTLSQLEVIQAQAEMLAASLERLEDGLGGARFTGSAVVEDGFVDPGTFLLIGPIALFRSEDGQHVGTAAERVGSLAPTQLALRNPDDAAAAAALIETGAGSFPFDATLGAAHKIEATQESLVEHVKKGGPVMIPIFAMAAAALLVALYKWLTMAFLRKPSKAQLAALLEAVAERDEHAAQTRAAKLRGPVGRMLQSGVAHLREPRDLIEEVLYETVLTTRMKLQRMLPFIAICAASAPLLGLLGTVTGIINTFKLITVFGSGDVKMLSGGISEALITTKFGLIVAIPSLLLHAFLSRKARGVTGNMESAAVAFVNQVGKTPFLEVREIPRAHALAQQPSSGPQDPALVRAQVTEILKDILGPMLDEHSDDPLASPQH